MASNILGYDPEAVQQQQLWQGLLGLGSGLMQAGARTTDPGAAMKGFGNAVGMAQQGVQSAKAQAMQDVMSRFQMEKMQQELAQRAAAEEYLRGLGQPSQQVVGTAMQDGAGPTVANAQRLATAPSLTPEQIALFKAMGPEAALKAIADVKAKEQEWRLKAQFEPLIAGATEGAKNPYLADRKRSEMNLDLEFKPQIDARTGQAMIPVKVAEQSALMPGVVRQAGAEAGARAGATMPYNLAEYQAKENYGLGLAEEKSRRTEAGKLQAEMQYPGAKPLTTDQANARLYATRIAQAETVLSDPTAVKAGLSRAEAAASAVPGISNSLISRQRQVFEQAERNMINAVLRRESGAVISPEEFKNARRQYIPQPGDGPEVLLQKAANRKTALEGIAAGGGSGFATPTVQSRTMKFDAQGNVIQ